MTKHLFQPLARSILAAVCLGAMTSAATAGGGAFTRGCAARDMQVLKMIEERETSRAVSAETLRAAVLTMMHARNICHEGYVVDALAIYDDVARSITPNPVLSEGPPSIEIH